MDKGGRGGGSADVDNNKILQYCNISRASFDVDLIYTGPVLVILGANHEAESVPIIRHPVSDTVCRRFWGQNMLRIINRQC